MTRARRAVVAAVLGALALVGCTPPGPTEPTPSPTPSVQTPTETPEERQERLDYAAAEKAYRTFRAEYGRVLQAGGAKEPTKVMKATAGGEYLATFAEVIRSYRDAKSRNKGMEVIGYVRRSGYSNSAIALEVCEDGRATQTLLPSGASRPGEVRTASLEVRKTGKNWRVWSGTGELVESCE